jgi:acyl-coenzyme A thioesterase PaaI-like protein
VLVYVHGVQHVQPSSLLLTHEGRQTVHGGLIMSLTDTLGSLAVASQGQYMTGVSTDISTSFVKPAGKPGDELTIKATLTAMGVYIVLVIMLIFFQLLHR